MRKRTARGSPNVTRFARRTPQKSAMRPYRMLQDEYEQLCVEYVSDYYAERGEEWWPYK